MQTTITINFTPEGKLELPSEISQIFTEGEQYSVSINSDLISFKKVPKLTWNELKKKRAEIAEEMEEMTTEEICEIVREVRNQMKK